MPRRIRLFGIDIDVLGMDQAVSRVLAWAGDRPAGCRYVVTPNLDHAVRFRHDAELREAYHHASLVLADGAPLVFSSRLLRRPLPERVAGSDLVPAIFDACVARHRWRRQAPLKVFLFGAAEGIADRAAARIAKRWCGVHVVGTLSPPLGFERDVRFNQRFLRTVRHARPDLLLVGLGAPKQELWVHAHHKQLPVPVAVCAGATIDFLAGHRQRSPVWMRRAGLEWLHRLAQEPRRLARRYVRDAWAFPQLLYRDWFEVERHG